HEPREPLQSLGNRPAWDDEATGARIRSGDRILGLAGTEEDAVLDPLRLNELELPPEVRSDECEHQSAIGAVVLEDSFRQERTVGGSTSDHSMDPRVACNRGIARVRTSTVRTLGCLESSGIVGFVLEVVVALRIRP